MKYDRLSCPTALACGWAEHPVNRLRSQLGREFLGIKWALRAVLILLCCLLYASAASAAGQRKLDVVDITSESSPEEAGKARTALAKGEAIVRMTNGSLADFKRVVGASFGDFKAFSESSRIQGTVPQKELKLRGIAAYRDENGILRSVASFALDDKDWQTHLDKWVANEQSKAATGLVGDPQPPSEAWTLLYTVTLQAFESGGYEQSTDAVYRLNTISSASDYYLVSTIPETVPAYTPRLVPAASDCDGISYCGWHTVERDFTISGTAPSTLNDHGPTGTISGSNVGFTVGGGVGPTGPNVSAGFSASWSQPDVTTLDESNGQTAKWKETFAFNGDQCLPVVNTISGVSKGTFQSRQAAIFQVPGGTGSLSPSINQQSLTCSYIGPLWDVGGNNGEGSYYDWLTIQQNFVLGPPVLLANPSSLSVPPGGTEQLLVSAYVPSSEQGVPWTITSNASWLKLPSAGPFTTNQIIPVSVDAGTALGSSGTISINTTPPFAAPSVIKGPIQVNVTVGPPKPATAAGVLVVGGHDDTQIAQPYFYDAVSNNIFPVMLNTPRTQSTATLLKNGDVLVVGGNTIYSNTIGQINPTNTAELIKPGQPVAAFTGSLAQARMNHTATLLDDGKVLIVGGTAPAGSLLDSAELYDPATGQFSPAGKLKYARSGHLASKYSAIGFTDVFVYGGIGNDGWATNWEGWAEPDNTFSSTGPMQPPYSAIPQPLPLADGTLDVVGGWNNNAPVASERLLLQPDGQDLFEPGQSLNVARGYAALASLPNGKGLLISGGANAFQQFLASAEIRDPNPSGGWTLVSGDATCPGNPGCLLFPRGNHTATLLPDGRIFIAGGTGPSPIAQTEFYDPATKTFSAGPIAPPQSEHKAIALATTTTGLVATPSSASFGQSVTLAATVTAPSGVPDGVVHFLDGQTQIGSAQLTQGQASFNTSKLAIGTHALTVSYAGDGMFIPSVSTNLNFVVAGGATQTSLTASPNPANVQQPVTLTAVVSSASGTITGSVVFKDGGNTLGTTNLNDGSAKLQVPNFTAGSHALSASFAANTEWGPSAGSTSLFVRAVTTSSLQSSANPSVLGATVTFTAKVTVSGGSGTPTGTVAFTDGSTSLGTSGLGSNGTAQYATSTLTLGTHSIVATYSGDNNFAGGATGALIQKVNPAGKTATSTGLSSSPNPSISGSSVSLTATITPNASSSSTPTGTVAFTDQTTSTSLGTAQLATVNGVQVALLNTAALTTAGAHLLVASYQGDTNFNGSSSTPYTQNVSGSGGGKVTPVVDLYVNGSMTDATVQAGTAVTFLARIHAPTGHPVPNGSITISDSTNGNNRYGSADVTKDPNSNDGLATIITSGIAQGSYSLVATYGGDNHGLYYNGARSNSVSLTVKAGVGEPPPPPRLAISAIAGTRDGTLVPILLTIANNGAAVLRGITLNQIALRTLAGTGQATLTAPSLPLSVGNLQPGASTVVTLHVEVPDTVRRLAITEGGIFQDERGTTYTFSPGQVLFP